MRSETIDRSRGPLARTRLQRLSVSLLVLALAHASLARASVALLMEEPYGTFGAFNPTGHAAVYLNHICAASPTELRPCRPGEFGVVISRYHKIHGYDWIAVPLIPYLYAVNDAAQVPGTVDKAQVAALRDAYRRAHLEELAPDDPEGLAPDGEWNQLVGSSYDRTIHGFEVSSTAGQDARFIALFNDRHNVGHFNLFFHNCADFSRNVLNLYLPGAIHRSFVADLGFTTPKQIARSLMKYDKQHSEVEVSAFVIPQVPGSVRRSHPVDGVVESLIKSKKYLLPMAVLTPEITAGAIVAYLARGRMELPKNATVFDVDDLAAAAQPSLDAPNPQPDVDNPPPDTDGPGQPQTILAPEPTAGAASSGTASLMR